MKNILKNKYINKICVKLINVLIPFKFKRRAIRRTLYLLLLEGLKDELSKKYPDYYQFALFQPWGDFIIPCSLFDEFKRVHNNAKILVACVNKNQECILKKFKSIDKIIIIDSNSYYALFSILISKHYSQKLEKGRLFSLSHWLFNDTEQNKPMNFLELYTKMLGLTHPAIRTNPTFKLKETSNTILLMPEAKSFEDNDIDINFWIEFANKLLNLGYDVAFNTQNKKFSNYKTTFLPMAEQIEQALQCKFVIGIRSGFNDILSICNAKNQIVIYPKNMYFKTITKEQQENEFRRAFVMEQDKTFEENMYRITSLKMFNCNIIEIVYQTDNQLKDEVINYIKDIK